MLLCVISVIAMRSARVELLMHYVNLMCYYQTAALRSCYE